MPGYSKKENLKPEEGKEKKKKKSFFCWVNFRMLLFQHSELQFIKKHYKKNSHKARQSNLTSLFHIKPNLASV